jgi:import receptor subunit TOM70
MSSTGRPQLESIHSIAANSSASASTSLWGRISNYVSEHKAVVYTVGAVVIIATAGGIYYVSQSTPGDEGSTKEKKSKKDRRKKDIKDGAEEKVDKAQGEMRSQCLQLIYLGRLPDIRLAKGNRYQCRRFSA